MAILAKILEAVKRNDGWKIRVEFTDDTDPTLLRVVSYRFKGLKRRDLIRFIKSQVDQAEGMKTADYSQMVGKVVDVTPQPPTPPTQSQIDKDLWLSDWHELGELELLTTRVPNLLNNGKTNRIATLKTNLETNWKNRYLGSL